MFDHKHFTIHLGGKDIHIETGKIARQADGSVMLRCGDTMILATACATSEPGADIDFLPLRVDYQEKFSSCGKTLGGFIKREGRPTERETLISRLIDRPLRPMFPDGYYNEIQVLSYVMSYDGVHAPEPLAICASSAALCLSSIPLIKPIGAVRVGLIDQDWIINPTLEQMAKSRLDLMVAGTEDAILMIEGYCDFLTEAEVISAVEAGQKAIQKICHGLAEFAKIAGKEKKLSTIRKIPEELKEQLFSRYAEKIDEAIRISEKLKRENTLKDIETLCYAHYLDVEVPSFKKTDVKLAFKELQAQIMRTMILKEHKRMDGRKLDEIRPIAIDLNLLPRTHGSALFTRGETQALAVCTLGGDSMGQRYEDLNEDNLRRFYLQYSFPPFSVGEVGRIGSPGRREVGHGKLAERALAATIPSKDAFPYTIRLESNITESNGSSSMASICGGCIAMMAAGVPLKKPVAGIAMGLILNSHDEFAILSDILGSEDALGDMDFKIAGDQHGITAFQLDIKVEGITHKIMQAALAQARHGRLHILHKMLEACPKPHVELSVYAPRIEVLKIKQNKIATLIGPGGKQIRNIIETTGVQIDIDDSGTVSISSTNPEAMAKAKAMVIDLTSDIEAGKIYKGKVVSIVDFGAFIKIFDKECLCHISELAHTRVSSVKDVCKEGDIMEVKVLEINDRGQVKLSRKALLPLPEKAAAPQA